MAKAARDAQLAAMDAPALVAELRALSDAGSSYEDQAQCCAHLCKASPLPSGAAAEDAVRAVVAALTRCMQDETLQLAGSAALAALVRAAPGLGTVAVTAVLAAMRAHTGSADVQVVACHALSDLALSTHGCALAGATGAVVAVAAAMARHSADLKLATRGCEALYYLTRPDDLPQGQPHNASAAVSAVLAAMRAFPAGADLQEKGCCALMGIGSAAALGGARDAAADAILAAMRTHAGESMVQSYGCEALVHIFQNNKNADAASVRRAAAAITIVTAALCAHQDDVSVLHFGCLSIACLMLGPEENKRAAGVGAAITAVVAALRAFPAAANLQLGGAKALGNMCHGVRDSQLAAAAAGALEAAISAMRTHASHANVQYAGCVVLGALAAGVPSSQTRAGQLGGVEVMMAALRAHAIVHATSEPIDFVQRWCDSMTQLARDNPINTHKAVAAGAIELLVAHVCLPTAAPGAMLWGCGLLLCLVAGTGHEARAVQAGLMEALEARRADAADSDTIRLQLINVLQRAALRHDAEPCAVAGCKRCTEARKSGAMCALPGCGARGRDGGAKKLLRCGTCRAACYCGAAHQREDWRRHKRECGAASLDDTQAGGGAS
jgi:hypothetical protein